MLDKLIDLVRENAGDAIISNPSIPNERNEEAIKAAGGSIAGSIQNALASGNAKSVMEMFSTGRADPNNSVVRQAEGDLTSQLTEKFGMNANQATNVAGSLVPNVMDELARRTKDPSDRSFDAQNFMNQLSGGKTSGMNIQGMLAKAGLDWDKDGDVDMQDLKAAFSGSGSILEKIKGMFK